MSKKQLKREIKELKAHIEQMEANIMKCHTLLHDVFHFPQVLTEIQYADEGFVMRNRYACITRGLCK